MGSVLRIGLGYDVHRFEAGGPLRLGGVDIDHDHHLAGHSDADALLHAVTDALLGAAALGDIGELFPDTDPAHRGGNSAEMLELAWRQVLEQGWELVNLDCVVHLQRPKLLPYREPIRASVARILNVDVDQIWLKAKTGESVGPIGRGEALAVQCVALLRKTGSP